MVDCCAHPVLPYFDRSNTCGLWIFLLVLHGCRPHLERGVCVSLPSDVSAVPPSLPRNVGNLASMVCVTWCLSHSSFDIDVGARTTGGSPIPALFKSSKYSCTRFSNCSYLFANSSHAPSSLFSCSSSPSISSRPPSQLSNDAKIYVVLFFLRLTAASIYSLFIKEPPAIQNPHSNLYLVLWYSVVSLARP